MRSAKAYKSAYFESDSTKGGFWQGSAIDKQVGTGARELSEYWIREFLNAELRTTPAAGSKRIAIAFRDAIKNELSLGVRQELISAATLLPNQDGQVTSGQNIVSTLQLSEEAMAQLNYHLPRAELLRDSFTFDGDEFNKHLAYRSILLDNGAMLIAENDSFESVFTIASLDDTLNSRKRFETIGTIVDESLRRRR